MELVGRHYVTAQPIAVRVRGTAIDRVQPPAAHQKFADPELSVDDVSQLSLAVDQFGVTRFCPTLTTNTFDALSRCLATIHRAREDDAAVARRILGIHLEGPFISPEDGPRGDHPRDSVRPPDFGEFQRLQEAAGGLIRLLTLAPELPRATAFIERVVANGVVVAIGHTAADADSIRAAVDAGARLSTHLGNATHPQLRRHPNYIWDQLAEDRLWASIVADGQRLPASVVKSFVRAKTPDRCILVSDMTGEVELPIGAGVAVVMGCAGISLEQAVEMASARPATLLAADDVRLEAGCPADLVQFDLPGDDVPLPHRSLAIRATINAGEAVYGSPVLADVV